MDSFISNLVYFGASLYLLSLWWQDYQKHQGEPSADPRALPGAHSSPRGVILLGIAGALFLLGMETLGEITLALVEDQSTLAWYLLFSLVAAAFIEEIIFRGYLVIQNRGPVILWLSAIGFSLLFVVIHPYLWEVGGEGGLKIPGLPSLALEVNLKTIFTSLFLFSNSLWFYWLRFNRWNPRRSLIPCFAAHLAGNLGVFGVKLAQGYIQF